MVASRRLGAAVCSGALLLLAFYLAGGGSIVSLTSVSQSSTSALATPLAELWQDVPADISLDVHIPGWAGCMHPPCNYGMMTEGPVLQNAAWNSQFGEDKWLVEHMLHNQRDGFYLEMGAMDGKQISNTRWLHESAGWKGLLIEACPAQYAGIPRNRPRDIAVHAAICGKFQMVHWLSKQEVGGIWEFMAEGFKEKFHRDVRPDNLPAVPCVPLMFLLDKFGINRIDFWSLDVEGAELQVLETMDFSRVQVGVLIVETDGHNATKDAAVGSLLTSNGYIAVDKAPITDHDKQILAAMNTVYYHKSFKPASMPGITELKMV